MVSKILVVGLGNPILRDDSVGIRVAEALKSRINQERISVVEASIAGLDFLDLLAGYDKAIIIDAVQTVDGKVGQIYRFEPGTFKATRHASTPHDVNFATALELGKKLNLPLPKQIIIFGIEVKDVSTLGEECTPEVEHAIPLCVEMVVKELNGAAD
jgi:hydrogenase maturation protease